MLAPLTQIQDLTPYLGELNGELYGKLNAILPVEVRISPFNIYSYYTDGVHAHVYVTEQPNPALFAHMLLHLQLYYDKILIRQYFVQQVQRPHDLFEIMKSADSMANSIENVKIFPRFLKMGYKREETPFFNNYRIDQLQFSYYAENYYKPIDTWSALDYFVDSYLRMKSDHNPAHSYRVYFDQIQAIDSDLFSILETFWNAWEQYDIEQKWTGQPPFVPVIDQLADSLEKHLPKIINKLRTN